MSFNWTKYIRLADELLKGTDESYYRSAISRAYYGAFCITRDRVNYSDYRKSDVHSRVADKYATSNDEDERIIGSILIKLRKARNNADYNSNETIRKDYAERMVNSAKSILEILEILNDRLKNDGTKE